MTIRFRTLFSLEVAHDFYGGPCTDFGFVLPEDTRTQLGRGRLLAREREGKLYVLYEEDQQGDPLFPLPGTTLRVGMRLLNPYFQNFTSVPAGFPGRKLHYTNVADPDTLALEGTVALVGPVFTHAIVDAARPVTVTLRDAAGATLRTDTVAQNEVTSVAYDLRGRPSGALEVEETSAGGSGTAAYYLDPELRRLDVAAVVEVEIDNAFYGTPPQLELSFAARQEVLRYYLVASNYSDSDLNRLSVSDAGFATDARPQVTFQKVAAASFTASDLSPSLISRPGDRIVLFRSTAPVPRRERGRRRIQLSRNNDVLIANLPQPGADRATADLVVHVSKP